jgi:hypothetical protein
MGCGLDNVVRWVQTIVCCSLSPADLSSVIELTLVMVFWLSCGALKTAALQCSSSTGYSRFDQAGLDQHGSRATEYSVENMEAKFDCVN